MKRYFLSFLVLAMLSTSSICQAEDEGPFSFDASVGLYSDYMFRGLNLYDGTSIQPSGNLNYETEFGTFSAGLWMQLPGEGDRQAEKFTEMDETIKYSNTAGDFTYSVGNVWYTYPDDDDDIANSTEVFATLSYDTVLTPTLSVFHDWDEYHAQYYELAFSQELTWKALGDGFNVTPYAAFGFASNAEGIYDDNGLEQITVGTSFASSLGDISLTPTANYTFKVDDATVNEFWVGVNFGY